MFKKIAKYFVGYVLIVFSFFLFFATIGYYVFIFEWSVSLAKIAMNAFFILMSFIASITIYSLADKIKLSS